MKKKIPTSGDQPPLQNPFASLDPSGFPEREIPVISKPEPPAAPAKKKPRVVLRREKARRGGKTVIVITQLPTHLSPPELENLVKKAKKHLGCGGAVIGRDLEIQGDQADRVKHFLEAEGFTTAGP